MKTGIVKCGGEALTVKAWWENFFSDRVGVAYTVSDDGKIEFEHTITCSGFDPIKKVMLVDLTAIESRLPSGLARDLRRCKMRSRHVLPS